MEQKKIEGFDWQRILLPEEFDWLFLGEVAFRTFFMFVLLLLFFKLSGKRSIFQLSLFELAIIVGLGSAAGDPMFYAEVGILPILVVFFIISLLYKGLTHLTLRNDKAEKIIEGSPDLLLENNIMVTKRLDSQAISYDEFFGFLRVLHVEHLGQVKLAYLEVTGNLSVFFNADDQVIPGLPILPEALKYKYSVIVSEGLHSCLKCGFTNHFKSGIEPICPICKNNQWIRSLDTVRIT
jgi:uncharacterized membrane protein YcaP (DUF421 family)